MITEDAKNKYRAVIGFRYSRKIQKYLDKKGVKNSNGKSYSLIHIAGVMLGNASHEIIEDAIFEVYKIELKKQEEKKRLLES